MLTSLITGTLRFVGGQISHNDGVTVNTPVAALGILGGVATVVYPISPKHATSDPNLAGFSGLMVIGHVGTLTLKNAVSQVTVRPGFAACVNGMNIPIAAPFRVSGPGRRDRSPDMSETRGGFASRSSQRKVEKIARRKFQVKSDRRCATSQH